jgi:hypothetical protein
LRNEALNWTPWVDTVKSVGKAMFQGDAVDASEYMTHSTIEIRSSLQYPPPRTGGGFFENLFGLFGAK